MVSPFFVRTVSYPVLFPFLLGVSGRAVLRRLRELEQMQYWPPERMREYQWGCIQRLLHHAYAHVPFYHNRFREIGAEPGDIKSWDDFHRLPPLTRRDIQEHLDDLLADNIPRHSRELHRTTGSTGTITKFWVDRHRTIYVRAMLHRCQGWTGMRFGERQAYLWASGADRKIVRRWRNKIQIWALNILWIAPYQLDDPTLADAAERMRAWRPKLLTSYPSTLDLFTRFLINRNIRDLRIPAVIATGEMLSPELRERIGQVLGAEVFDRYGSIELGDIAQECQAHDGLHINSERVYVETIPCPACSPGVQELVITDLNNFSTPFLRYQIEDFATRADGACACGRRLPRLERIEGRRLEQLRLGSGRILSPFILMKAAAHTPGVAQFQWVQTAPNHLVCRVVPDERFSDDSLPIMRHKILDEIDEPLEIEIELVESLSPSPTGKFRTVFSNISRNGRG